MKTFKLIFIFIVLYSCNFKDRKPHDERTAIPYTDSKEEKIWKKSQKNKNLSLDSLWNILKLKDGCLTGGQNIKNNKFGNEGCVMSRSAEWKTFLNKPKIELTEFLISKLDKRDTTNIHTCPFFSATEGELAVYSLQAIHKKNWFDSKKFERFKKYSENQGKPPIGNRDNFQGYLNDSILTNKNELEVMKDLWLEEIK